MYLEALSQKKKSSKAARSKMHNYMQQHNYMVRICYCSLKEKISLNQVN